MKVTTHAARVFLLMVLGLQGAQPSAAAAELLEQQLSRERPGELVTAARRQGDAQRGAVLFHDRKLGCATCHLPDHGQRALGPELTKRPTDIDDAYLVESVLAPSKRIRLGYETIHVATDDGRTIVGLLAEDGPDVLVLRDVARNFESVTIAKSTIEERQADGMSLMPAGLVNQLAGRDQFLDLLRYVLEISEFGPQRMAELRPPPGLFDAPPLPEYERYIDHAGLLADAEDEDVGRDHFRRGEAIYQRVCANCHGTYQQPGSLPAAIPFASGRFKNGADPYSIYRTLTHGFGLMAPQTWMVPQEKYDVIYYLREAYLRPHNETQYVKVDGAYLAALPKGDTRGPPPRVVQPWEAMDYGRSLINTYEVGSDGSNFAYKGIAVRLDRGPGGVARGRHWLLFDHDTLRVAAAWSRRPEDKPSFIDYNGIHFNGRHQVHPRSVGDVHFTNRGPGWADPRDGRFDDERLRGRDDKPYGPLPRSWGRFRGLYRYEDRVILSYSVGDTPILEMPGLAEDADEAGPLIVTRAFNIGPRSAELVLQVADLPSAHSRMRIVDGDAGRVAIVEADPSAAPTRTANRLVAGLSPDLPDAQWGDTAGELRLCVPAGEEPLQFTLWMSDGDFDLDAHHVGLPPQDLTRFLQGGAPRWPQVLSASAVLGGNDGPFAIDVLPPPPADKNPWLCQMRLTGFDFFDDGQTAAVCTWDGDVWLVRGLDRPEDGLSWQRIGSGLFQPLGLKIVGGKIYVACRDQIVALHDLNGDGETDYYETFNSDHQVTEHFHEFAMGLQADAEGYFYYAKSARHALPAIVPQHGTLLRVSPDGHRTDILATGFRAANGVCLNPDGTFFVTDQEGHWMPKNRINWVEPGGHFYGNLFGYHNITDQSDAAMQQPLCWITNSFDRSPGELLWVTSEAWGKLQGSLLQLSYGTGKIFVVPHETVAGQMQGGMCALPMPIFPTGVMRGRFHPTNGQLYVCGMFAWAGNQMAPGGFYRVRHTGKPIYVPISLHARRDGIEIQFSGPLAPDVANDPQRYGVRVWSLKRSEDYGSPHYDERQLRVASASLASDRCSVLLELPDIAPTWCMAIDYRLKAADGSPVVGEINNTIHRLEAAGE
ncbi:MAG TPA: DUF6797 domain-containing protein [Pirellulales bacterium]|nr:DUF6797 domain-containing protein [Pirellulales bacterium]